MLVVMTLANQGPPLGPPTAKFVAVYGNHDRSDCDAAPGNSNEAFYFNATPGLCFRTATATKFAGLLVGSEEAHASSVTGVKFLVGINGVNIVACGAGKEGPCSTCSTWHKEHATQFGQCDQRHRFTVDMTDWLPSPTPGRVLERVCDGASDVSSCPEQYTMLDTSCSTHCRHGMLCADIRLQCGSPEYTPRTQAVRRPSSHEYLRFTSVNGTCTGPATQHAVANYSGSGIRPTDGAAFRTVWCGEKCARWKTLRARYPYCDPPDDKTSKWAIDLDAVLGGRCSRGYMSFGRFVDPTPPGECCHVTLGAGHPAVPFGTPCSQVCHEFGREGHDDEWCQHSSGATFGYCFCGPERWSGA